LALGARPIGSDPFGGALNRKTGHRIKYAKVDADTGEEVANEDIVKGYKIDTDTFIEVTKEELENVALESTRTIEIDEFVDREEIDPRYLIRPYYLRPDGKVGHDAFAVIRETIREMNKVAIGRVVLTNREHIIALEHPWTRAWSARCCAIRTRSAQSRNFRRDPRRQGHQGHARPRQAHRQPEVGTVLLRHDRLLSIHCGFSHVSAGRPTWVIRVDFAGPRRLPVYPGERTFSG
jgi:hypothetical protein